MTQLTTLECRDCKHRQVGPHLPMLAEKWAEALGTAICNACGGKNLNIVLPAPGP